MKRISTVLTGLAALIVITSCSSSSTISGQYRDTMISSRTSCVGATLQIVLTDSSGKVIARDAAPFDWTSGACVIPFSFASVPRLPGYGVRISGISGTHWLTPSQASNPVRLTLSGF